MKGLSHLSGDTCVLVLGAAEQGPLALGFDERPLRVQLDYLHPGEFAFLAVGQVSRIAALDGVLRAQLARFPDARYAMAARALFGMLPAESGQNLTVRRELAACVADHEVHHFRKRVEPRLLTQLAAALLADGDRFTRSRMIAPRLAPATRRQEVPQDPFAWELAEHEEALSRLWAVIYAARAELLAVDRLLSFGADRQRVIRQAIDAAWHWAQAGLEATSYAATFGTGNGEAGDSWRWQGGLRP